MGYMTTMSIKVSITAATPTIFATVIIKPLSINQVYPDKTKALATPIHLVGWRPRFLVGFQIYQLGAPLRHRNLL